AAGGHGATRRRRDPAAPRGSDRAGDRRSPSPARAPGAGRVIDRAPLRDRRAAVIANDGHDPDPDRAGDVLAARRVIGHGILRRREARALKARVAPAGILLPQAVDDTVDKRPAREAELQIAGLRELRDPGRGLR